MVKSIKATTEAAFWRWFAAQDDTLFHFEHNQEMVFDQLTAELYKVHADLTFEFGPVRNGRREFVISAGGIKAAFPAVERLHAAAPTLPRWAWVKFRPRRPIEHTIQFGDREVRPEDVQCTVLTSATQVGLYVYIRGYQAHEKQHWAQIGYLFLDGALGELDVETKVGVIEILPPDAHPEALRIPLRDLPAAFDATWAKLQRKPTRA